MDGYLSEIRGFAGTFNPQNWMLCQGQLLNISQYSALYSLLGTTYGGNGSTNFQLPDLRGRVPMGCGQGTGLTNRPQGTYLGTEYTQLTINNLPVHSHVTTTSPMSVVGTATGTITPRCYGDAGGVDSPAGSVMGSGSGIYAAAGDADANMAPINASLTLNGTVAGNITVGNTGGSQPMLNIQPSLAINWIICVNGLFPMRS
jgi:microcystin-dependent protein